MERVTGNLASKLWWKQRVSLALRCALVAAALAVCVAVLAQDPDPQAQPAPGVLKGALKGKLKGKQQPAEPVDPTQVGRMEGIVTTPDGKPVAGAAVRVGALTPAGTSAGGGSFGALSDDDGKFVIEGITPGPSLGLTATKNGYSAARYGAKSPTGAIVLIGVKAGETLKDLVLLMPPQGVVVGRVLDPGGEPLEKAQVTLLRREYQKGARELTAFRAEETDDRGEFRIPGLPVGRYYLIAHSNVQFGENMVAQPTFYPQATDLRDAVPVDFTNGEEKRGVDIRIRQEKVYAVKGRLAGLPPPQADDSNDGGKGKAQPTGRGIVQLVQQAVADGTMSATAGRVENSLGVVRPDGTFELKGTPGRYVVQATTPGAEGRAYGGQTPVIVGGADVEGVLVTVGPGLTITGKVTVDGGVALTEVFPLLAAATDGAAGGDAAPAAPAGRGGRGGPGGRGGRGGRGGNAGPNLTFTPLARGGGAAAFTATFGLDGSFKAEGVQPGNYYMDRLTAQGTYIKSILVGGGDMTRKAIHIEESTQMEIVVSKGATQVNGTLKDDKGTPIGGAMVVLWPEQAIPSLVYGGARMVTTDSGGAYSLGGVAPGKYYEVAFEDANGNMAFLREFVDQFTAVATKVEVSGMPATVTPAFVPSEKIEKAMAKMQ